MVTDTFGSPSLGEGIALQAQPKDYTPQFMRAILADQDKKLKQEQKKFADELAESKRLMSDLSKFKVFGAGVPAFIPEYARISQEFIDKYQNIKKTPGVPVTSNIEYYKALSEAQQKFDKLRFEEDIIKKALEKAQNIDKDTEQIDQEVLSAYLDETGEKMRAVNNGKIGLIERPLIVKKKEVDILKYAKNLSNFVKPKGELITDEMVKQYEGTNDKVSYIDFVTEKVYDKRDIENATNIFLNSSEMLNYLDREEKKHFELGVPYDREIALLKMKNLFEQQFKNAQKEQIRQIFENRSYGGGSSIVGAAYVTKGIFTKDVPVKERAASVYKAHLQEFKDYLTDPNYQREYINEQGERKVYGYNPEIAKEIGITKETDILDIPKLVEKYNNRSDVKRKGVQIGLATLDQLEKQAQKAFKDDKNAKYIAAKDRRANKEFELIDDEGRTIYAVPQGITKIDGDYRFIVDERRAPGYYVTRTIPLRNNAARLANDWLMVNVPNAEQGWIDLYEGSYIKKQEGGLIEPKEILKKYHDKTKKMTKIVFTDGTEQILKGLL